jgi:hypothetical protein
MSRVKPGGQNAVCRPRAEPVAYYTVCVTYLSHFLAQLSFGISLVTLNIQRPTPTVHGNTQEQFTYKLAVNSIRFFFFLLDLELVKKNFVKLHHTHTVS